MNIVYLFLTYKNPELLLHTIQRLKAPHVDASSGEDFSYLQGIDGVYVFVNQHNTKWGTLSIYAIHLTVIALLISCLDIDTLQLPYWLCVCGMWIMVLIISYLCHILIGKNRCLSLLLLGK
jgi:prepilin signal peptidase PulO-like enzyme (type II secretory pathway)